MKHVSLISTGLVLFLSSIGMQAQGVITSAGSETQLLTGSYVYSVGEICGQQIFGSDYTLSEGASAIYDIEPVSVEGIEKVPFDVKVYPNPVVNHLCIQTEGVADERISFTLTDILGHIVSKGYVSQTSWTISLDSLPTGIYTLVLTTGGQKSNYYRIIKKAIEQ